MPLVPRYDEGVIAEGATELVTASLELSDGSCYIVVGIGDHAGVFSTGPPVPLAAEATARIRWTFAGKGRL